MATPQEKIPLRTQIDTSGVRMDGPSWAEIVEKADNSALPFSHSHFSAAVKYAEFLRRALSVVLASTADARKESGDEFPELQAAVELSMTPEDAERAHLITQRDVNKPEQNRVRSTKKASKKGKK